MRLIKPRLYTYRRCPYAIRSRLALHQANIDYESIEISLKDKSSELLALSPKGTVPVLVDVNGEVIEESLEIMLWALNQNDPACWCYCCECRGNFWINYNCQWSCIGTLTCCWCKSIGCSG